MIIEDKVITGVRPYTAQEIADNEPSFWNVPTHCKDHSWLNADHVVTYCLKADGVWFTSTFEVCASCAAKYQAEIQPPPPNVLTVDEFNRLDRWKLDINWGDIQGLVIILAIIAGVVMLGGLFTASNYDRMTGEEQLRYLEAENDDRGGSPY